MLVDESRDADLLVVGSRGHGGFAELLLGSVSQQCAHHAECPVVIVHAKRERLGVMSLNSDRWVDENALQHQLRDLVCLAVVGDHVRWVLTDDDELGDWLAEAAAQWRGWAEQVAAQLVTSQVAPDGRVRSLAKDIP